MTIPYYGKREPGSLTAASPGDTLYFAWGAYNDSGDSEAQSGFAVTDIEVIKNGAATVRATDSGYSLISDTGQVGDRVGLYRCSIQLFNTADDASFYASGSTYQAFVDSVTIDGKTVRFWLGSWEIGRQKVNAVEINSDTGAANQLENAFANGFADTGIYARFNALAEDTGGVNVSSLSDTGINDRLAKILADTDTGIQSSVNVTQIDSDTGAADVLSKFAQKLSSSGLIDTGVLAGTQAGTIDSNIRYVNEVEVGGTGASGSEWGPA